MEKIPEKIDSNSSDEYTSISDTDSLLNSKIQNSGVLENYDNLSETEDGGPAVLEGSRSCLKPTNVGASSEDSSDSEIKGEISIRVMDINTTASKITDAQPSRDDPDHSNLNSRISKMWVRDMYHLETVTPRENHSRYHGQPRGARRGKSYGRYQQPNHTSFQPQMESIIEKCEEMIIGENKLKITITNITPKKSESSVLPTKPSFRRNSERRYRARRNLNFNHYTNPTPHRPSSSRPYEPRRFISGQQRSRNTGHIYTESRPHYEYSQTPNSMSNSYAYPQYVNPNPNVGNSGQYFPPMHGGYNYISNPPYIPHYPSEGYMDSNEYSRTGYLSGIPQNSIIPETGNSYLYDQNYYYQQPEYYGFNNLDGT